MYLVFMDQQVQNDIAASVAVHHELGRDYDDAVAEGLVDRIGSEIDKRVDAKLAEPGRRRRRSADVALTDRHRGLWLGVGIGSAATGITTLVVSAIATSSIDKATGGLVPYDLAGDMAVALISVWVLLAVIGVIYAWVRHARDPE
jgi:hypothetical protein